MSRMRADVILISDEEKIYCDLSDEVEKMQNIITCFADEARKQPLYLVNQKPIDKINQKKLFVSF